MTSSTEPRSKEQTPCRSGARLDEVPARPRPDRRHGRQLRRRAPRSPARRGPGPRGRRRRGRARRGGDLRPAPDGGAAARARPADPDRPRRPARALLADAGVDAVLVVPFTREVAAWTPERFVATSWSDALHAQAVVVGANFRFGVRRPATSRRWPSSGRTHDFTAEGIALDGGPQVWSSTYVRNCLRRRRRRGRGRGARPPVHRARRGRQGRPARPRARLPDRQRADLRACSPRPPTASTPAGCAGSTSRTSRCPAAISVGTNPTFEGERERRVESYVLDRDDLELYGVEVEVSFVARHPRHGPLRLRRRAGRDDGATTSRAPARCSASDGRRATQALRDAEQWFLRHGLPYFVRAERAIVHRGLSRGPAAAGARRGAAGRRRRRRRDPGLGRRRRRGRLAAGLVAAGVVLAVYAATTLRLRIIAALGGRPDAAQPRADVPAGHPGAAAAAAVHHVPVHQHRGLDGGELARPGRAGDGGDVLRRDRGGVPAGAAARGDGPRRRRHRPRPARRAHPGHPGRSTARPRSSTRSRRSELREVLEVAGLQKWNLVLVLLVSQFVQVLLLSVAVLVFFLVFGSVVMQPEVVGRRGWAQGRSDE